MSVRNGIGLFALAATLTVVGCGNDGNATDLNGDGSLTAGEKAALIEAITTTGVLALSPAAAYAPLALGTIDEIGTISASRTAAIDEAIEAGIKLAVSAVAAASYEGAVGVQIGFDVRGIGGWFIGVLGWNGLNAQTRTVSEMVAVFGYAEDQGTPPPNIQGPFGGEALLGGSYWNGMPYYAMSGDASITGSNFSGSTDCSVLVYACSYATGTMSGNFGFTAQTLETTDTYEQVPVSFTVPAVSLTVTDGS